MNLTSHGRGRWFDPSIAHSKNSPVCKRKAEAKRRAEKNPDLGAAQGLVNETPPSAKAKSSEVIVTVDQRAKS